MNTFVKVLSSILLVLYYWLESIILAFVPKRLRYKDVSNETVLITGAGSGIGRLLAVRFARLGARIVIWDVNTKGAEETVQIIKDNGGEAYSYECDISKAEKVYECAKKVKNEVGKVTILINNAGIVTGKRFLDCPDNMIQKTFEVNVISHFWTCKAFLPDMIEDDHGHIVSIASMAGLAGVVRLSDYCASKFAAVGFEESLRMELHVDGHKGINSTVICPYFINTGMFEGARPGIFTMMTPDYVADEIVSAVLVNQEVLLLPKMFYLLLVLKAIIPTHAVREAMDMLSILSSMSAFSGRDEKVESKPQPVANGTTMNGHVRNSEETCIVTSTTVSSDENENINLTKRITNDITGNGHVLNGLPNGKLVNGHVTSNISNGNVGNGCLSNGIAKIDNFHANNVFNSKTLKVN